MDDKSLKSIDRTPLDELILNFGLKQEEDSPTILYKLEIPASDCCYMYGIIKKMNYSAAKLFPGYDGVRKLIDEDALYARLKKN